MKKRILTSLMVIGLVGALAGTSTMALFNDTESSNANSFETGALDLKLGWEESYNGEQIETQDLEDSPGAIFDFKDIKPGDSGKSSVKVALNGNPGWVWMRAKVTADEEIKLTEPETTIGDTDQDGELDDELEFTIWKDDGDGELQENEEVIKQGRLTDIQEDLREGTLLGEFQPGESTHIGIKWNLPRDTGNRVQKDRIDMDFQFYTEQRRHNDNPENPWNDEPAEEPEQPDNPEDSDNQTYYQVDLVGGEPIENLSESTYHSEGRMQRFMHGGPGEAVSREEQPDQVKTGTEGEDCVNSQPFQVNKEADTVTVNFKVLDKEICGTGTKLSLVSYEKPYPGWVEERAGEQKLFDSETTRFEPGNHSLTVEIPDVNDREQENGQNETDGNESDSTDSNYTVSQGNETVEVEPLNGNISAEELYDYRLPDDYNNEADNNASNGATYPDSGPYYESAGTDSLQKQETSIMFLYQGPEGMSFVVVHDKAGGDGGSATWNVTGLESGDWIVKDDLYLDEDGSKAGTNYDDWQLDSNPKTINWTWGSGGTDGGVYKPLGDEFSFTISPAFNEESPLYNEFYQGDIDDWQILSGSMENPERTSLNLTEDVTVHAR